MAKVFCAGDVHGDFDRLIELLEASKIIRSNKDEWSWTASDSTLIFIGDLTDRGRRGLEVIQLVRKLQGEAELQGGLVESLLGNHDALFLATALEERGELADDDCKFFFRMNGGKMYEAQAAADDLGLIEWLRARPMMYQVSKTLFQHADGFRFYRRLGASLGIEEVNRKGAQLLQSARGAYLAFSEMTGDRDWNDCPDLLPEYLKIFGAERVIHGHSRHEENGPKITGNGQAVNVDNSMCWAYRQDVGRGLVLDLDDLPAVN